MRFFDTNHIKVVAYSIKIASIFWLSEYKNARNSFSELRVFFESLILCYSMVSLSTFQCKMLHYKLTAKNCKREKIASKINMQNITYYLHFSILFSEYFKLADYMKLHRKHFLQSWEFHLDNFGHLLLLVLYHLTSGIMGITTIRSFFILLNTSI